MTSISLSDTTCDAKDFEGDGPGVDEFRVMLVVTAHGQSRVVALGEDSSHTIGRGALATIQILEPSLSRVHAEFRRCNAAVTVTDLESRNGTLVGGKPVREAVLRAGDTVVLGTVPVTVQVVGSRQSAILGLSSYDEMLGRIEAEWMRSKSFRRPFAILVMRAAVKSQIGACAEACRTHLRSVDHLGVYDPNSLLLLLPETDAAGGERLAGELRAATGSGDLLQCGVSAYPESGFTPAELVSSAARAVQDASWTQPLRVARSSPHVRSSRTDVAVWRSQAMVDIAVLIERVAPRKIPVLVLGETGTGKELVAREIHASSPRRDAPLTVVNCATIPEQLVETVLFGHAKGAVTGADRARRGVFEAANGGTVFLDEVGELSPAAQAALLLALDTERILPVGGTEEIRVDIRVVAATHRNLPEMVAEGTFRLDLFNRLNTMTLTLPPLRERREEIRPLAKHFITRFEKEWQSQPRPVLSDEVLTILEAYHWPGNVRELKNVIERALVLADGAPITPVQLPAHVRAQGDSPKRETLPPAGPTQGPHAAAFPEHGRLDLRVAVQDHELNLIRSALARTGGHQARAAEILNIPLRTLERRIQKLGLSRGGMGPEGN